MSLCCAATLSQVTDVVEYLQGTPPHLKRKKKKKTKKNRKKKKKKDGGAQGLAAEVKEMTQREKDAAAGFAAGSPSADKGPPPPFIGPREVPHVPRVLLSCCPASCCARPGQRASCGPPLHS